MGTVAERRVAQSAAVQQDQRRQITDLDVGLASPAVVHGLADVAVAREDWTEFLDQIQYVRCPHPFDIGRGNDVHRRRADRFGRWNERARDHGGF